MIGNILRSNSVASKAVVHALFENIPVLNKVFQFIDGNKTTIGRLLLFITAILGSVNYYYPEVPYLGDISVHFGVVTSWFLIEFGIRHKFAKDEIINK